MQPAKPGSDWDYAVRKHNKVGLRSLVLNTITPRFDSLIIMTIIMISAPPKFNLHKGCMIWYNKQAGCFICTLFVFTLPG